MESYQSIVVEGGDQVGKGTALNNLVNYLSSHGVSVLPIAFPHYGFPIGSLIRKQLKNNYIKDMDIDSDEKLTVKNAMYTLDRLIFVNYVYSMKDNPLIVFDRGPYSCCVSTAYHIFENGGVVDDSTALILNKSMYIERFLIKKFNTDNCVLRLYMKGNEWRPDRGQGDDIYEVSDVQMLSNVVYEMCGKEVGKGWLDLVTRVDDDWRTHEEILSDMLSFIKKRLPNLKFSGNPVPIKYVSTEDIVRAMCDLPDGEIPKVKELDLALKENCKVDIYEYGRIVGEYVINNTDVIFWQNGEIKEAVRNIFDEVESLEVVINDLSGSNYGTKLLTSANE